MQDKERDDINTHNLFCDFGKHKGTRWTRVPVSYLLWMVNSSHSRSHIARAELNRRGTTLPEIDISGHAIDRASQCCLKIWKQTREGGEGLYHWLCRVTMEAMKKGRQDDRGRYVHLGIRFAVEMDGDWPVLKTVLRKGANNGGKNNRGRR